MDESGGCFRAAAGHLNGKLFGPPSWIAKWTPSNRCFGNISHVKQYRKSILVAMTTFLAVE